uniref:type VI lipase adapter Tla3 domain-containing protein n=1 Tax=Pseudomonas sp. EA_35y_Pfl1_P108 TaxID=3088688 RepID=UPI0030D7B0DD
MCRGENTNCGGAADICQMGAMIRQGIVGVFGALILAYSGHWWGKAVASEEKQLADYRSSVMGKKAEQMAEDARTYALEIRGVGIAVDEDQNSTIWKLIQKKNDNFASIYSQDPNDYNPSLDSREITQSINIRAAFKHSASDSVAYWPIPVFAIAPPKQPEDTGAVGNINSGRNAATLGVTLFLWQDAENTIHAQGMIERLFQFFDANPKVPQALVVSRDGDVTRNGYRVAGTPGLQNVSVIPTVYESMTGLLVTRSDRVERYIRPFVTNDAEDNQNKNTDLGKLWAFYWDRSRAFDDWYLNT